jgi:aminopeptidase YwaD
MINFEQFAVERPLGSESNYSIIELIMNDAREYGYNIVKLPINAKKWSCEKSFIEYKKGKIDILPSPFSGPFSGEGRIKACNSWNDITSSPESILLFREAITKDILMPLNFPVYFPEEHKVRYSQLIESKPRCIITETGKSQISGLDPCPFFEDGNLKIPSAYKSIDDLLENDQDVYIEINSHCDDIETSQLILSKDSDSDFVIVVCAHMDSKYNTPGALDNAAGLYTLITTMNEISRMKVKARIHIIPFNGEENYGVPGQQKYMEYINKSGLRVSAVVNIDSPGFKGSSNVVSFYNIDEKRQHIILNETKSIKKGIEWYAGDHAMFAFKGVPCIVATSSNLFEKAVNYTHTPADTKDIVDIKLLEQLGFDISSIIKKIDEFVFA